MRNRRKGKVRRTSRKWVPLDNFRAISGTPWRERTRYYWQPCAKPQTKLRKLHGEAPSDQGPGKTYFTDSTSSIYMRNTWLEDSAWYQKIFTLSNGRTTTSSLEAHQDHVGASSIG